jgi:hypothetical protein
MIFDFLLKRKIDFIFKECGIIIPVNTESCLLDAVLFVILTGMDITLKIAMRINHHHLHPHLHNSMMEYIQL